MTKPNRYYITPAGMAASLANPDLFDTISGVLAGNTHPMTVKALTKRGFIEIDRRLPLGALKEVRGVLLANPPQPHLANDAPRANGNGNGHAKGPVSYTFLESPKLPKFSPSVERVLTVAKSMTGPVTCDTLHAQPELARMNVGTLRWAIQVLRRSGLCESSRSDEPTSAVA